jgi:hypothetical protein
MWLITVYYPYKTCKYYPAGPARIILQGQAITSRTTSMTEQHSATEDQLCPFNWHCRCGCAAWADARDLFEKRWYKTSGYMALRVSAWRGERVKFFPSTLWRVQEQVILVWPSLRDKVSVINTVFLFRQGQAIEFTVTYDPNHPICILFFSYWSRWTKIMSVPHFEKAHILKFIYKS